MRKKIIIIILVVIAYFLFTGIKSYYEDSKIVESYNCGTYDLAIQMNIRRNAFEGDGVGYKITYNNQEFKDTTLYYGNLYDFSFSNPADVLPLNSNILVKSFSNNSGNLVTLYVPKSNDLVPYKTAGKKFTDAEFLDLGTCMQKNEIAINKALSTLKLNIPKPVLERSSNFLSNDMPQLGSLVHIDRGLLNQKIRESFFEKKSDVVFIQKIFTNKNTALFINFKGEIQYTDDYIAWEKRGGGDTGTNSLGSVFTTNPESKDTEESILGSLDMKAKDGSVFIDHLIQGQKVFGIKFTP